MKKFFFLLTCLTIGWPSSIRPILSDWAEYSKVCLEHSNQADTACEVNALECLRSRLPT